MTFHSPFLHTLQARGFIQDTTHEQELDAVFADAAAPVPLYIGFDCTADSLHVGSLLQIMALRWLQDLGHKPIILLGGGTTKVGDPSGKDETRQLLDEAGIAHNLASIERVFAQYLRMGDGPTDAIVVNNADWLDSLGYIEFLRDVGSRFSVNRMLSMESVKRRLDREQHLSFLEFNYMLLQAYDFVELQRRYGCAVQMGGSDQWGNITAGMELGRRMNDAQFFGITSPLITTASGAKMGKTADGAVWLSAEKLAPYDFWQFWRNTEDADVGRFLRYFTLLPLEEIERLEALEGAEINQAKIVLANEATALCHGRDAANAAQQTAEATFAEGGAGADLPELEIAASVLASGLTITEALNQIGFVSSNGEAKRLIKGGGAKLNDAKITDGAQLLTEADFTDGQAKLSAGKKKHGVLRLV